jgi:hypothetical protein
MRLNLKRVNMLTEGERAALKALTQAVYPPDVLASSPGRHIRWAPADYSLLISAAGGELVSHVGIFVRRGTVDRVPAIIGGVGSVKTHPTAEGRGYATAGLRRAVAILDDEHHVDFSLLVCQDHLLPFYGRLGWLSFPGRLLVDQPSGQMVFTINRVMVRAGHRPAPANGTIDLQGPPW